MGEGMLPPIVVELLAKAGEFHAEMREAGSEVKHFETKSSAAFGTAAKIGKAALFGIAGASVAVGTFAVEMADKYEVSHAKLEAALKGAGSSFDQFKGQIDGADKKMEKLGFTNAETQAALAQFTVSLGSPVAGLKQMGLASDLARFKHISLAQAALLVSKAMQGQIRPLKALGIDLPVVAGGALKLEMAHRHLSQATVALNQFLAKHKDAINVTSKSHTAYEAKLLAVKNAQFALGQQTTASTQILAALHQKLDGQASTAADTFGGKVLALKVKAEDLGAKLGMVLIPMIEKAVAVTMDVVNWFGKHKTTAEALAVVVGGVLVAAIGVYVAGLVGAAASSVASLALMVAGWVGYESTVVVGSAATEVSAVSAFVTMMAAGVAWAASMVASAAAALLPFAPIIIAVAAVGFAAYELYKHWDDVWNFIKKITSVAVGFITKYADEIGVVLVLLGGPITVLIGAVVLLWKHWNDVWGFIKEATSAAWSFLKAIFDAVVHAGLWFIKTEIGGLKVIWHAVWSSIQAVVSSVWGALKTVFNAVVSAGLWIIKREVQGLETIWSAVWDTIKSVVSTAWNVIKSLFSNIVTGLKGLKDTITSALSAAGTWLLETGKNIIKGLVNGIKSLAMAPVNAVKDIAHGIMGAVTNPLKIFSPSQVMHANGVHIAQGLANGIKAGGPAAVAAAAEMARLVEAAGTSHGRSHHGHRSGGKSGPTAAQTAAAHAAKIHAEVVAVMKATGASFAVAARHIAGAVGPIQRAIDAIHHAHTAAAAKIAAAHQKAAKHIEAAHKAAAQVALTEASRTAAGMVALLHTAISSMQADLTGLIAERDKLAGSLASGITLGLGNAAGIFADTTKDLTDATKAQKTATDHVTAAELTLSNLRDRLAAKTSTSVADAQALAKATEAVTAAQTAATNATADYTVAQASAKDPVATLTATLMAQLASAQTFGDQLKTLTADGASKELIQNIASQGADAGGAMAAGLLAKGPDAVLSVSKLMGQIAEAGRVAADAIAGQYYDQGISSVQHLIDGMKSKEVLLQAQVARIADIMLNLNKGQINAATALGELKAVSPGAVGPLRGDIARSGTASGGTVVHHTTMQITLDGRVVAENTRTHLLKTKDRIGTLGLA